jgi:hypothetical protein
VGGVEDVERLNQMREDPRSELGSHYIECTDVGLKFVNFCTSAITRRNNQIRAASAKTTTTTSFGRVQARERRRRGPSRKC